MRAIGLGISDTLIRFVELVESRRGLVLGKFGEQPIPRGIVEGGEVKKVEDLRAILTEIKNKYGFEFVVVSLPEEKSYLFEMRLPKMKLNEVRGSIELSLEEYIPHKADEVVFDYDIREKTETEFITRISAVPRALIDGYLEAFMGSGITPIAFEMESESVARSIVPEGDDQAYMVVDFGRTRTGITIVADQIAQFTSTVATGSGSFTDAIVSKFGVSREEAEQMKKDKGVFSIPDGDETSNEILTQIALLRANIKKHAQYWGGRDDIHKEHSSIKKIYVCGADANIPGFIETLASGLGAPVELAQVMRNVNSLDQYIPEISFEDSLHYATAVGLALRHVR